MREKLPVYGKIAVLITPCCDIAITLERHFTKDTLNFANPTQLFYGLTTYECIHASFSNETNCVFSSAFVVFFVQFTASS